MLPKHPSRKLFQSREPDEDVAQFEPIQVSAELLNRLWDPEEMVQYVPIRSPPLDILVGSEIRYYKNGKPLGLAFKDLYEGKYHPAISLYNGATATVNFGPNFEFQPPKDVRPFSEVENLSEWKLLLVEMKRKRDERDEMVRQRKQRERDEKKKRAHMKSASANSGTSGDGKVGSANKSRSASVMSNGSSAASSAVASLAKSGSDALNEHSRSSSIENRE